MGSRGESGNHLTCIQHTQRNDAAITPSHSYPVRTHVSGFDESFNAITGLNGSGKSNILDAICFVLGITNMSAVSARMPVSTPEIIPLV